MPVVLRGPHGRWNFVKSVVALLWESQNEVLNSSGVK